MALRRNDLGRYPDEVSFSSDKFYLVGVHSREVSQCALIIVKTWSNEQISDFVLN